MERALMEGMFWAGMLLSSIPLTLGIAVGIYALRRLRESDGPDAAATTGGGSAGAGVGGGAGGTPEGTRGVDVAGHGSDRPTSGNEQV